MLNRASLCLASAVFLVSLVANPVHADEPENRFGDQNATVSPPEANPILPGLFADASLAKFGDTFFIYATTDGFGWPTGRWITWRSKDFVNWSFSGESFPEITGQENWAPGKPLLVEGKYYFPFTWHNPKGHARGNYMAVGDEPAGPFHVATSHPLADSIDPEIFRDDDGSIYYIQREGGPGIWKMKKDLSGLDQKVATLNYHKGYVEGPFIFKRKGVYYAAAANLGYAEYCIIYAMADNIAGPWKYPDNNYIIRPDPKDHLWGTGHGSILQLPGSDDWILIYLRSRMGEHVDPFQGAGNVYRQTCAERLSFRDDGTIVEAKPTRKGVGLLAPSSIAEPNLAFGKTATASSSLTHYGPEKAIDECNGSRWLPGPGEWIVPAADSQPTAWQFTTSKPAGDWVNSDFDSSNWQTSNGGFGTPGTPHAIIGTKWDTSDIYLRREFELKEEDLHKQLKLRMHHDDDAEVYLNGVRAIAATGFITDYESFAIDPAATKSLHPGKNMIAVHCHQVTGGQYIDVGLLAETAPWWHVDLGSVMPVHQTEIFFNYPTEITPYTLLFSEDGSHWQTYAEHLADTAYEAPKVDRKAVKARYLRVQFHAAQTRNMPAGIWEFKVR